MSEVPSPPPSRSGRALPVRLLAVLALAALAAAACSSSHRPAAAPVTSLPPPTTTTTEPPPQYAPSPYSWDRVTSPTLAVGGGPSTTLSAVLAPPLTGPWLLFGTRLGPSGSPTATMWSSGDALSWSSTDLSPGTPASQAAAAARYRTETVIVGATGEGAGEQAAVWLSGSPGAPFTAESVPATNGPSAMTHVTAGAVGMFATGTVDGRFAMWSSTNGHHWSELTAAEKTITSSPGARVDTLLAEGSVVYAAGSVQPGADEQAALWVTGDGLNWRLVGSAGSSFSGPGRRVIYSLAPLGRGLVAVGAVDQGGGWTPASWISPDGQSWSLPSTSFASVPGPAAGGGLGAGGGSAARSVSAIPTVAGPNMLIAAGGGPYGQAVWESSDGLHWASLGLPAADAGSTSWRAEVAAATADRAVVLDAEPGQPYLLTDRVAGAPAAPGGAATSTPVPGTWSQPSTNPAVFGPVRDEAVPVSLQHAGGRLELLVDVVRRPQVIGPATVTTEVLVSTDGSSWNPAPSGTALPGHPPRLPVPGALAGHLPTGWVAVSSSAASSSAASWNSTDGTTWARTGGLAPASRAGASRSTTTTPTASGAAGRTSVTVNGLCTARLPTTPASTSAAPPRYLAEPVGEVTTVVPAPATAGSGGLPSVTVTRYAAAWSSPTGAAWQAATVGGAPPAGATSSMSGCEAVPAGLVAFGAATGPNGTPQPALWRSADGSSWARVAVTGFAGGTSSPLVSLATAGSDWMAAANPSPTADPLEPGVAGARGPAATAGQDAGVGPSASVEDGREALWLSVDTGGAWQLIDTATAPWLGIERSQIDLVGFASGSAVHATSTAAAATPVVVGTVDGQLAVWVGAPVPQASAGGA